MTFEHTTKRCGMKISTEDTIYVGFNSRVAAMDRKTGEIQWAWKSPKGTGFVSLLLDDDQLVVSVQGYMFCLDPATGEQLWYNEMEGFGYRFTVSNSRVPESIR